MYGEDDPDLPSNQPWSLWLYWKQLLFCHHDWKETGGTFMGAEKVCHKCRCFDSMTGIRS